MLVRDASGRMVSKQPWQESQGELILDLQGLSPGMYAVELIHSGRILDVKKLTVE